MTEADYLQALTDKQYTILAYYSYDTGFMNSDRIVQLNFKETRDLVEAIHVEARTLVGLSPFADNKSAVELLITGQTEPVYLCLYDFSATLTRSVVRRLGKEYVL